MEIMQEINTIESQLTNIEEQKKELLLKDLFLKSKLIFDFLKTDEFVIQKQEDVVSGDIFEDFPMSSIVINHNDYYYDFNEFLEKFNLSIADLEIGAILQKDTKITIDMSFEKFKENVFNINKNILFNTIFTG